MNKELTFNIGAQTHKVFLQDGFYESDTSTIQLHNHNYAEVHVIDGGKADFNIDETLYHVPSGSLLIIPRNVFHSRTFIEKKTRHTAFQIDYDAKNFSLHHISTETVSGFFSEIKKCRNSGDYTGVSAYISLLCSYFDCHKKIPAENITDCGFLIHEFFSTHYSENLHIRDLAEILHLSERQTERLVVKHTGKTFREELTSVRMNIAKELLNSSDMSLKAISEYCGYSSYAGFWKAMKKHIL